MTKRTIEQEINERGKLLITAEGRSMTPMLLPRRSLLRIEKKPAPYRKYDVVLFRGGPGRLVLHRIIGVDSGKYLLRGDASDRCERGVGEEDILGVLTGFVRKAGKRTGSALRWVEMDGPAQKCYARLIVAISPVRRAAHRVIRRTAQGAGGRNARRSARREGRSR